MRIPMALIVAGACFAGALTARAETAPPPMSDSEAYRVLAVEDQYVAAEVSRDEQALRRIVDERFVFNASNGQTTGKEELIRDVLGMAMTGQDITERSVLIEDDIALVFGTTELRFASADGEERVSVLRYTSTYVKRQDGWRLLALQMQQRASQD